MSTDAYSQQKPNQNLHDLINKANKTLGAEQATRSADAQKQRRKAIVGRVIALIIGLVAITPLVVTIYLVADMNAKPSRQQVERDLKAAISMAEEEVETVRAETGALPDALPDAALAAVVRYEPEGERYRLTAELMGVAVTRDADGKVTAAQAEME